MNCNCYQLFSFVMENAKNFGQSSRMDMRSCIWIVQIVLTLILNVWYYSWLFNIFKQQAMINKTLI